LAKGDNASPHRHTNHSFIHRDRMDRFGDALTQMPAVGSKTIASDGGALPEGNNAPYGINIAHQTISFR
jgi:hypothetical protein